MNEQPESPFPGGTNRRFKTSCRAWSDRILLLLAAVVLAFFVWNTSLHGMVVREDPDFQAWSQGMVLLLCAALAVSLFLETGSAWLERLERKEPPPLTGSPSVRERSFRMPGPARPLIRHCTGQLEKQFRNFYAFHRYQAPYVAHLYFAKKGSLALLGLPWMKTGFLLFFLVGYVCVARGDFSDLRGWETAILSVGCFFVIAGLLVRVTVPYRKAWLRIVEENNRICLTVSCCGRSKDRWFETFCRSIETQAGVVSCSTHSR